MKGQRLFVRPLSASDFGPIAALQAGAELPASEVALSGDGLVGRLAGSTVAYLLWSRDGDAFIIASIFVATELRGIRIGSSLLADAAKLAAEDGATSLRVAQDCKLARYFERRGFVSVEGTLTKAIR
ncbi:MAG: GNAT family N-acetyltransferase [Thermoanaerobaculia bacterium]|jgi:predicted N-acetyltransferase YhbS